VKLIVDTDCGTDDLLALAYLTSRPDVELAAITTVHGLSNPVTGAENVARLMASLGQRDIPIYIGCDRPSRYDRHFPLAWRAATKALSGVTLPGPRYCPQNRSADAFLRTQLLGPDHQIQILALGPLTNIAKALDGISPSRIVERVSITAMGGAFDVPGNLDAGGAFDTKNQCAEWNFYVDPWAAEIVLESGADLTLVPLDASNSTPILPSMVAALRNGPSTPASTFAVQVLASVESWIQEGHYYAWDPLAAAILVNPQIARIETARVAIELDSEHSGRTTFSATGRRIGVVMQADKTTFETEFIGALRGIPTSPRQLRGE
jgi:pyrimidine-specific ribonucleoside hydrolase